MQLSIHTLKTIMIYALMICPIVLMCQGSNWSDPSTWPDDRVPRVRDNVEIPAGRTIYLDISPPELGAINIRGELIFAETDLELTAKTIVINGGLLQIGTEDAPFEHRATITLNGPDEDLLGMGARHLAVMSGGRLDLHGASANKRSWTQISGSLASGSSELVLAEQPDNWAVGDEFVLAPSGYDPYEAERLTIEEINGNRIRFSPALAYEHYGEIQNYTLGDGTIQELDERAEVGMLTRNIIIQGAEDSQDLRLGGHIMIMQGSGPIQVEGIGLRRMGQPGRAGRYSFHWHLCGDRTGDYVRDCSVYDGLQRGIVVHGTDNVRVENNVGYNIQNHIFIPAEDGNEVGNYFINNLAVLARRVDEGFFAFPNSGKPDRVSDQAEHRPSGFWMRNLHNILIGNHVAGAERGVGFFFDRRARHRDFRYFDALDQPLIYQDNVAHSISVTTVNNNAGSNVAMYARVGHGFGIFIDDFQNEDVELIFEDFVFYKCDMSGVWNESDNVLIRNSVFADNTSAFISGSARVEDALVVGRSANQLGENRVLRHGHDRTGFYTISQGGKKKPQMRNVSFFNMHEDTDSEAAAFILDFKLEVKPNYVEDIYVEDSRPLWMETRGAPGRSPDGANLYDMDGSLTGYNEPVTVIWPTSPLLRDDCDFVEEWNAYICPPDQFIDVQFDFDPSDVNRIDIDIEQEDGTINYINGQNNHYVRLRGKEDYRLQYNDEQGPQAAIDMGVATYALNPGDFAYLWIPYPFGGATIQSESGVAIPRVGSELSVRNSDQAAYFINRLTGWILFKFEADSEAFHWYRIRPGESDESPDLDDPGSLPPEELGRLGNVSVFPNPISEHTQLNYELFAAAEVSVEIVDVLGRQMGIQFVGFRSAGDHRLPLEFEGLQPGVYSIRISTGSQVVSLPIVKQ